MVEKSTQDMDFKEDTMVADKAMEASNPKELSTEETTTDSVDVDDRGTSASTHAEVSPVKEDGVAEESTTEMNNVGAVPSQAMAQEDTETGSPREESATTAEGRSEQAASEEAVGAGSKEQASFEDKQGMAGAEKTSSQAPEEEIAGTAEGPTEQMPPEVPKAVALAALITADVDKAIADKDAQLKADAERPLDDGVHKILDEATGEVTEILVIENGMRNGICEFYFGGIIYLKATYINDVKDGPAIEYDPKGEMARKVFYRNDVMHGVVETYERGRVTSMAMYEDDQPHGLRIDYDNQGNVVTKFPKVLGETQGVAEHYDKLGHLVKTCEYVRGIKHGFQKIFFPDGKLQRIEEYDDGLKVGTDRDYYPNGALRSETEYKQGKIVRARVDYTIDGKIKG